MPIRVYYEVLNQKGTPALYSDNYAQRPAAGYVGRIFYSPDTAQIFYDTGSTWTLLADAGVGSGSLASVCANGNTTATGISITAGGLSTNSLTSTNLTAGSIPFIGTGGLFSQDNTNLFWDNTNKYFGINTNTPSTYLDVHGTNNVAVQINNTTTADSKIAFLQAGAGKWRIGNLYSGGTNLFHIYNNAGSTLAMQINSSNAALFYGSLSSNSFISAASGITLTNGGTTTTAGATNIGGLTAGLNIALASGFNQTLTFPTGVGYTYTFPSATGTLALTSNLSSYLPLSGGTLSGALTINSTLYINPTNTSATGLDVASDNISFRSDNLEGSKRQLLLTMGSGTLIQFTAQGYGAARGTDLAFYTSAAGGVNSTPAIYIAGNNKVGFGTGSPSATIHIVSGTNTPYQILDSSTAGYCFADYRYNNTTYGYVGAGSSITGGGSNTDMAIVSLANLVFGSGSTTERARINSSGNFLINTTSVINSNTGMLQVISTNASSVASCFALPNGASGGVCANLQSVSTAGTGWYFLVGQSGNGSSINTNNIIIYGNGNIQNTNNSYGAISDISLKENVINATNKLNDLLKIRIVNYNLIGQDIKQIGVIAQELEEVFPSLVETGIDGLKGVKYSVFVPMLIKAVQELNDKIENLN